MTYLQWVSALSFCWVLNGQSPSLSTIHFNAVNVFGNPLKGASLNGFIDDRGKDWAGRFHQGIASGIPYGTYRVKGSKTGYFDFETVIEIVAKETWMDAAFETFGIEGDRISTPVEGRLTGSADADETITICKLEGVYLRARYDTKMDAGTRVFNFGLVAPGTYILTCLSGATVVALKPIRIDGGRGPLEVSVGATTYWIR